MSAVLTPYRSSCVEVIGFDHVSLTYESTRSIFNQLSYSFFSSQFYFLTGPSGSGKTSLLRLIYKDILPTQGSVRVFGKDISALRSTDLSLLRQRIGLVFQDFRLCDHLNALDNVALALKIAGSDVKKSRSNARELLHWVGLADHLYLYPCALSDGQKQRVAIARAVITRPLLLLADEPTGNVDEDNAYKLVSLLERLNQTGTTVVMATHNRQLVKNFSFPEISIHKQRLIFQEPTLQKQGYYARS